MPTPCIVAAATTAGRIAVITDIPAFIETRAVMPLFVYFKRGSNKRLSYFDERKLVLYAKR